MLTAGLRRALPAAVVLGCIPLAAGFVSVTPTRPLQLLPVRSLASRIGAQSAPPVRASTAEPAGRSTLNTPLRAPE